MNYHAAKAYILDRLKDLSERLTYHSLYHTLDVLQRTTELCVLENIPPYETLLLKTAALYHDAGFLINNKNHEQLGCGIAREGLARFDYTREEIDRICGMIMATKVPQQPQNELEKIICDADLDYLGRADFKRIGENLFTELKTYQVLDTELAWNKLQISFLSNHRFFTSTNQIQRAPQKQVYLEELEAWVAAHESE